MPSPGGNPTGLAPGTGTAAALSTAGGAALAAGATVAAPLSVPVTQAPLDARGNTVMAAVDRGGVARPDTAFTGVYTGDGPQRQRPRRGLPASSIAFSHWLDVLGARAGRLDRDAEENAAMADAMQWVFWILAIVAYACLGFAIVALLPAASDVLGHQGRRWTVAFAAGGLVAAACAWFLARRMGLLAPGGSAGPAPRDTPRNGQR